MNGQTLEGFGLHSGAACRVTLERQVGPVVISQAGGAAHLPTALRVGRTDYGVEVLAADLALHTVEHLFAALSGLNVQRDVAIRVWGPEIPLLDGCAVSFVRALDALGVAPASASTNARVNVIERQAEFRIGPAWFKFQPAESSEIEVHVEFAGVGAESAHWNGSAHAFRECLAPARTFGFRRDAAALRAAGRARFVDPRALILFEDDGSVLAPSTPPRPAELARHKLLDLLGDLYPYGGVPRGRIEASFPGHTANHAAFAWAAATGVWTVARP